MRMGFWAAIFSVAIFLIGCAVFVFIENITSSREGGASFAFLAWLVIGPPLCFIVLPLLNFLASRWKLERWKRYVGLPFGTAAVMTLFAFGVAIWSSTTEGGGSASIDPFGIFVSCLIFVFATWVPFAAAMEWAEKQGH